MIVTPPFNIVSMTAREFEDLLAAQRRAMVRDIPTSNSTAPTETPTLTKAELAEMLRDRVGLNKQESKEMVEAFRGDARRAGKRRERKTRWFWIFPIT